MTQLLQRQTKGMPGTKNDEFYSICHQYHLEDSGGQFSNDRSNDDYVKCATISTSSTMFQTSIPTLVYKRKRQPSIKPSAVIKPSDGSHSAISSETLSVASQEHTDSAKDCVLLISDVDKNDNCSSSKSNLEIISDSFKIDMNDSGECSCSGDKIAQTIPDELSERDICISILRSQGILDRVWTRRGRVSSKSTEKYSSKPCKICERLESTSNLLTCDNCEDSFHISCCDSQLTRIPVGEWLCSSCLKQKHKIVKETSENSESDCELGSLEFMLRETEPYMSCVKVGDEFQANVPVWRGRVDDDYDLVGEPLEMQPCKNVGMQGRNSIKPLNLNSIGNWLQCREVIEPIGEGGDETICGKWRRAPLFEVQTDKWECHCCILWDPAHADCSVPQELETEEVMKQLKYVEMLRPRLAAKRRKLNCSKSIGS